MWVVHDAGDELELLLHPSAEVPDLLLSPFAQLDALQPAQGLLAGDGPGRSLQLRQVDQYVQYLEILVQAALLRQVANAPANDPRRLP